MAVFPMRPRPWRPPSEAEAVSTSGIFVEWLRAVQQVPLAGPAALAAWAAAEPPAFAECVAAFAGLDRRRGWAGNLLCRCPLRDALAVGGENGTQRAWSRADLRAGRALPAPVAAVLGGGSWEALVRLAADHLLVADTRPDDRLVWSGDPADPWPYGAWLAGAAVVLAPAADAVRRPA